MLVSLNKNKWIYDWVKDNWEEEFRDIFFSDGAYVARPSNIKRSIAKLLNEKGYRTKVTSSDNLMIFMKDEEYTFLLIKYSS